jgi:hypothetical protein
MSDELKGLEEEQGRWHGGIGRWMRWSNLERYSITKWIQYEHEHTKSNK